MQETLCTTLLSAHVWWNLRWPIFATSTVLADHAIASGIAVLAGSSRSCGFRPLTCDAQRMCVLCSVRPIAVRNAITQTRRHPTRRCERLLCRSQSWLCNSLLRRQVRLHRRRSCHQLSRRTLGATGRRKRYQLWSAHQLSRWPGHLRPIIWLNWTRAHANLPGWWWRARKTTWCGAQIRFVCEYNDLTRKDIAMLSSPSGQTAPMSALLLSGTMPADAAIARGS